MSLIDALSAELTATQAVLTFLVFLLAYYWYRRPKNSPPGPRGFPLLGVVPWIGKFPEQVFAKWSKTYGPIMSVRMGTEDWVVLNDYDSIQEALVKKKDTFSSRPRIPVFEQIHQNHGLVFIDGPRWKSQRKFGLATLRGFGVGKRSMEERVQEEVEYLCKAIQEQEEKPFDILAQLTNAVSNNICSVICGKRFGYDDKMFTEVISRLSGSFVDPITSLTINILIFMPALTKVPPFSWVNGKLMDDVRFILDFLRKVIAEHKLTFDKENPRDFIDAFIQEMDSGNDDHFTEIQLLQFIRDLFVAGTETTTSTVRWSILSMIHYPNTQKKLYEEIKNVVGSEAAVTMQHKSDMPYTSAFIEEIYRFRTLVPLNVPHATNNDITINGYFIPKNTKISPNLWAVHNDPSYFKNPDVFQPERHLDDKGMFVKSGRVIPFSVGPRHCLGEQLARMEVFIFLVSLVQKFEFQVNPNDDKLPEIADGSNGAAFVPLPFKVVAKER